MSPKNFLLLVLFFLSKNSFGQSLPYDSTNVKYGWIYVTTSHEEKWYVRSSYNYKQGNIVEIWVKKISAKEVVNGISYKNVVAIGLNLVDCSTKRSKLVKATEYSSTGKIIMEAITGSFGDNWNDAKPGTLAEQIVEKICVLANK